jgi:hypothetical protein
MPILAYRSLLVVVAAATLACSDAQPPAAKSQQTTKPMVPQPQALPVRPAQPNVDSSQLLDTMQRLVATYNKGSFVVASRYVADSVVDRCGGAMKYALANKQNSHAERVVYEIERVEVTGGDAVNVEADVYYSSRDAQSGKPVDVHQGNGLAFAHSTRTDIPWVLQDAFPIGVSGYCR